MSDTKEFSLGAILSVIHRRPLAPRGTFEIFGLVSHIMFGPEPPGFVCGVSQEALDLCAAALREQLPWIDRVAVGPGEGYRVSVRDWAQLDKVEQMFGAVHAIRMVATRTDE